MNCMFTYNKAKQHDLVISTFTLFARNRQSNTVQHNSPTRLGCGSSALLIFAELKLEVFKEFSYVEYSMYSMCVKQVHANKLI